MTTSQRLFTDGGMNGNLNHNTTWYFIYSIEVVVTVTAVPGSWSLLLGGILVPQQSVLRSIRTNGFG